MGLGKDGGGGGEGADPSDSGKTLLKFEDMLKMAGDSGKWQIIIFLFTWIEGMLIGCHHLSSSFLGASMGHWCNTSHMSQINGYGWTLEQIKNYSIPM